MALTVEDFDFEKLTAEQVEEEVGRTRFHEYYASFAERCWYLKGTLKNDGTRSAIIPVSNFFSFDGTPGGQYEGLILTDLREALDGHYL
jgi:hypothetical protein